MTTTDAPPSDFGPTFQKHLVDPRYSSRGAGPPLGELYLCPRRLHRMPGGVRHPALRRASGSSSPRRGRGRSLQLADATPRGALLLLSPHPLRPHRPGAWRSGRWRRPRCKRRPPVRIWRSPLSVWGGQTTRRPHGTPDRGLFRTPLVSRGGVRQLRSSRTDSHGRAPIPHTPPCSHSAATAICMARTSNLMENAGAINSASELAVPDGSHNDKVTNACHSESHAAASDRELARCHPMPATSSSWLS